MDREGGFGAGSGSEILNMDMVRMLEAMNLLVQR